MDKNLCNKLKTWAEIYHCPAFIANDPIQVPRQYTSFRDIEISAFITSWLSFGNRKAIIKTAKFVDQEIMKGKPLLFIKSHDWSRFHNEKDKLYRFLSYHDFWQLCDRLHSLLVEYGSIDHFVFYHADKPIKAISEYFHGIKGIPDYSKGSACKRLCLLMRWMVRGGCVDMDKWCYEVRPRDLIIPLDTHVHQVALELGITRRKQMDMRTAKDITAFFKEIWPDDPCLGDFALFGYGVDYKV